MVAGIVATKTRLLRPDGQTHQGGAGHVPHNASVVFGITESAYLRRNRLFDQGLFEMKRCTAALIASIMLAPSAQAAAVIASIDGTATIDTGNGFVPLTVQAKPVPGDRIVAGPNSAVHITYTTSVTATSKVVPGQVFTVPVFPPGLKPMGAVPAGAAGAAAGAGGAGAGAGAAAGAGAGAAAAAGAGAAAGMTTALVVSGAVAAGVAGAVVVVQEQLAIVAAEEEAKKKLEEERDNDNGAASP